MGAAYTPVLPGVAVQQVIADLVHLPFSCFRQKNRNSIGLDIAVGESVFDSRRCHY
jgi:hypothetical protein